MWTVAAILITGAIAAFEAPGLYRNKLWRELGFFLALLLIGLLLAVLHTNKVRLPNPLDGITIIYKPLADLISRLLG